MTENLPQAAEIHEVQTPKGQDIWKAEARRALEEARTLKVANNDDYVAVGELREKWAARAKGLFALLNPACQDADRLHSKLVRDRDECVKPFEEAAKVAKSGLIVYDNEQERIRRLEQARLDLEAKKQAEDRALELAQTLEAAGAPAAAQQVLDEPLYPEPVILPKATPKIAGFTKRKIYSAEVVDRKAFLAAIVSGEIPDPAWIPDMQFLNKTAGAMKEAMKWPGVKVTMREV